MSDKKTRNFKEFRVKREKQHDNLPGTPSGPKIKAVKPVIE
ncbi:hypothetical protein [Kamptonema sp. UHCC 0994]|nr:hypothetical protein [Kamptonema sp. UHCC 0994]MDF0553419.1 hypothetical protein [Kamptonema sp. UHCC 0994]